MLQDNTRLVLHTPSICWNVILSSPLITNIIVAITIIIAIIIIIIIIILIIVIIIIIIIIIIMLQGETSSTEPWYKTPYTLSDIPQSWLSAWRSVSDERMFLPHLNPFIPTNFDLIKVSRHSSNVNLMLSQ